MAIKKVIDGVKENVAWIFLTSVFMVIPFYYNTASTLNYLSEKVETVTIKSEANEQALYTLTSSQMVQQEKLDNIEKRLESIEKKLDYLIENDN